MALWHFNPVATFIIALGYCINLTNVGGVIHLVKHLLVASPWDCRRVPHHRVDSELGCRPIYRGNSCGNDQAFTH